MVNQVTTLSSLPSLYCAMRSFAAQKKDRYAVKGTFFNVQILKRINRERKAQAFHYFKNSITSIHRS